MKIDDADDSENYCDKLTTKGYPHFDEAMAICLKIK